mmetsp:Transcript_1413/g.2175  ORF Transcript_1413/g.2175 Transcript_1413/m.2175 type:complete len:358 (-) Transcript_1413:2062-3135(-)
MGKWCNLLVAAVAVVVGVLVYGHQTMVVNLIQYQPVDLSGKTAIVTGATAGIGLEAARKLAEWNASVIIMARNVVKGEKVAADILKTLPSESKGTIKVLEGRLDSPESIRKFVSEFEKTISPLHILMNNAGMFNNWEHKTADNGIEITYQVNHLGPFLLTELLIPAMQKTKEESRVVMVSSGMHYGGKLGKLDKEAYSVENRNNDPNNRREFDQSYADTKYFNTLYANALNNKLQKEKVTGITANSVHPGFVNSELDRNLGAFAPYAKAMRKSVARDTPEGAIAQVTVATHPGLKGKGGYYFEDHCIVDLCSSCKIASTMSLFASCNKDMGVPPAEGTQDPNNFKWIYETSKALSGL